MAKQHLPYDHEQLRNERQYGFYWYSGLWRVLRPILVVLTSLVLVFGLASTLYGIMDEKFISAVNPNDQTEIPFSVENGQSLTRVATNLADAGIIKNHTVFK